MLTKSLYFRKGGWFASLVVLICLTWAGANFAQQSQAEYVETEVALENAIAGSGDCNPTYGGLCCSWNDKCRHPYAGLAAESIWVPNDCFCI